MFVLMKFFLQYVFVYVEVKYFQQFCQKIVIFYVELSRHKIFMFYDLCFMLVDEMGINTFS